MTKVFCLVEERFVNPLFEVFDGGDFVLSSWRDIEAPRAEMRIFVPDPVQVEAAGEALRSALGIVGIEAEIRSEEIRDEDWKFAYRRHFKTEAIGRRLLVVPTWEDGTASVAAQLGEGKSRREKIVLDPGMAFGTGKHETTKACLQYIDELASVLVPDSPSPDSRPSFLDMGCGSGILSIAAAKLGYGPVAGFDVDQEAVDASIENAELNGVKIDFFKFALGRAGSEPPTQACDLVVANILGPLLIRFADEIVPYVKRHVILSGILTELYPDVLATYEAHGLREVGRKTLGEWTTGLLERT